MRRISVFVFVLFALSILVSACSSGNAPIATVKPGVVATAIATNMPEGGITAVVPTVKAAATALAPTVQAAATALAPTAASAATSISGSAAGTCANAVSADLIAAGQTLYATCAACHGPKGEGVGSFPALAGNAQLTQEDISAALQKFLDPTVHPFVATMSNQDVASVLSYVQANFNSDAAVVCPEVIDAIRPRKVK